METTTDKTYNGWTNRATWLVPLHFESFFDDMIKDEIESNNGDKQLSLENIRESIESSVTEIYEEEMAKIENTFVKDLVDIDYINYSEIAENLSSDIFKEWYEEKIDELSTMLDDFNTDRTLLEEMDEIDKTSDIVEKIKELEQNAESTEIEIERLKTEMNS